MLYRIKAKFQKMVRWIAGGWMTANQATFFGWLAILAIGTCLYVGLGSTPWCLLLVLPLSVVRLIMNALDGMLARERKTASAAGELGNEASDIFGDTVSYGVLFFVPGGPVLSLTLFLILTWAAEFFGVLAKGLPGGIRRHDSLGGGKPERAMWISVAAIWLYFSPESLARLPEFLVAVSVLIGLTCALRIRNSLRAARGKAYTSYTAFGV